MVGLEGGGFVVTGYLRTVKREGRRVYVLVGADTGGLEGFG